MSLYADYVKEREGTEMLEDHNGFVAYKILGPECFLSDMYLQPSRRGEKMGSNYLNALVGIARERNCQILTATVDIRDKNHMQTLAMAQKHGFKIAKLDNVLVWIKKELK